MKSGISETIRAIIVFKSIWDILNEELIYKSL